MKTLDEVIKAWSICFSDNSRSNCTGCPYADEDGESACFNHDREDALHYLKEYRSDKLQYDADRREWYETWQEKLKKLEESRQRFIDKLKELDIGTLNNPLTWDELRTMEGKPVWVEMEGYKPNWGIVMNQDKRNGRLLLCGYDEVSIRIEIDEEGEGKGWQAYRKERE